LLLDRRLDEFIKVCSKEDRIQDKQGIRAGRDVCQNRIQFKNPLEQMLEEEYGAAIVSDEFNDVPWDAIDPDDPYTGLAQRILSNCLTGSAEHRIGALQRLAREYRIDGAINPCHWGCRQGTGARGLIEKGLNEVGVPVLNLEVTLDKDKPHKSAWGPKK